MDELTLLREKIDKIDDQIFSLLEMRFAISKQVKTVKSLHQITVFDPTREKIILERIPKKAYQTEIKQIYQTIFALSKAIQEKKC